MKLTQKIYLAAVLMGMSFAVNAQLAGPGLPQVDQSVRPSQRITELPGLEPEKPEPKFVLPPVTIPDDYQALSARVKLYVKGYEFSGNTVVTDDELVDVAQNYMGRIITSQELEQLRRDITLLYVNKGYINSGALIPDQKVEDGIIRFEIIEGSLTVVEISGNERLREEYLQNRLVIRDDEILNVNQLGDQLKLLQQNPRVDRLNARLGPGTRRGEAILDLEVEEAKPYSLNFAVNNYQSPSVGAETGQLDFSHLNLTGSGDSLRAIYEDSHGLEEYFLSYAYPIGFPETNVEFRYEKTDSIVVEEPFDLIDIESDSETYGINLSKTFVHTLTEQVSAGLGFDRRTSDTYLLGQPFSFSPGVEDGESKVSAVRFTLDWIKREIDTVYAARSVLSFGVDGFDATDNDVVDANFLAWLGQFQMAKRLNDNNVQFVFKTNLQLTNETLLPMEKFSMGGRYTVRGYRENQYVRDNGITTTLEFRVPFDKDAGIPNLSFVPFFDYGRTWDDGASDMAEEISSIGAGLIWGPVKGFYGELYATHPLNDVEIGNVEDDLQDMGLHFQIGYQVF